MSATLVSLPALCVLNFTSFILPLHRQKTSTGNEVVPETVAMDIGLEQLRLLPQTHILGPTHYTHLLHRPPHRFRSQGVSDPVRPRHLLLLTSFDKRQGEVTGASCSSFSDSIFAVVCGSSFPWDVDGI